MIIISAAVFLFEKQDYGGVISAPFFQDTAVSRRYRRVYFYFSCPAKQSILKKSIVSLMGHSAHESELPIQAVCSEYSYSPNAHAAFCCKGVCCNSPLPGRKGVIT